MCGGRANMKNLLNMHSGSAAGHSASANNNGSASQLLTNTPLTLVATSNGGITLTALGSLHQHQQQQTQQQQHQQQQHQQQQQFHLQNHLHQHMQQQIQMHLNGSLSFGT